MTQRIWVIGLLSPTSLAQVFNLIPLPFGTSSLSLDYILIASILWKLCSSDSRWVPGTELIICDIEFTLCS